MSARTGPDGAPDDAAAPGAVPWLERLGLHRAELRAWAWYEWAITGMWAVMVAAIFPVYYQTVAGEGLAPDVVSRTFAVATTLGIVVVALAAPVLGAVTDHVPIKKRLLGLFVALGAGAAAAMAAVGPGDWLLALALFVLVNVGANGSTVFYDALLPHIARHDEVDRVSTGAYAVGYLGAGLLLAVCLLVVQQPGWFGLPDGTFATRLSFVAVAVWWVAFSLPLARRVPEPLPRLACGETRVGSPVRMAVRRLAGTARDLRGYRHAFVFLLAYLVYGDGIGTIIRLATLYGAEIGIGAGTLVGAILVVQMIGVPCSFVWGAIAGRIGTRSALLCGLAVYAGVTLLAYFMTTGVHFLALAVAVGTVQGGTQALSRSLFASMIPAYRSGELFGLYGVVDKFSGVAGPAVFAAVVTLTGSSRHGILSVLLFFVVGAGLLALVDVDAGRATAKAEQERAVPTPSPDRP